MSRLGEAFAFFTSTTQPDFQSFNNLPFPAFIKPAPFTNPKQALPEQYNILSEKQTLNNGSVLGLNKTISSEVLKENVKLKQILKQVPRDLEAQMNDSKRAMNLYQYQYGFIDTKHAEFKHYGVLTWIGQIVKDYSAVMLTNSIPTVVGRVVCISKQRMTKTMAQFLQTDLAEEMDLIKHNNCKPPVQLLNVSIQDANSAQAAVQIQEVKGRYEFQVFEAQTQPIITQTNYVQLSSTVKKFTSDMGAKLLILEDLDFTQDNELADVWGHVTSDLFVRQVQFIIQPQIIQSGGSCCIKTRELNGQLFQQLIQILNCFFDEVFLTKPLFSRLVTSERWIVCKLKKRLDYNKIKYNALDQTLTQLITQLNNYTIPPDYDEEFTGISSFFDSKYNNKQLEKYIYDFNTDLVKIQNQFLKYQLIHFAFSNNREEIISVLNEMIGSIEFNPDNFKTGTVYPDNQRRNRLEQKYLSFISDQKDFGDSGQLEYILSNGQKKPLFWQVQEIAEQKQIIYKVIVKAEEEEKKRKEEAARQAEAAKQAEQSKKDRERHQQQVQQQLIKPKAPATVQEEEEFFAQESSESQHPGKPQVIQNQEPPKQQPPQNNQPPQQKTAEEILAQARLRLQSQNAQFDPKKKSNLSRFAK
ncbi:Conserved_hypothetical protein [Hexamita inflata]|uniref:Ribosomal RNA methyltransferase FtsJ domain-containing protein n=1 Tax=Hexamita inflata TaxID=28002 RepID=A0ABP1HTA6_9EUKA